MAQTLSELRLQLTGQQRDLLSAVWRHRLSTGDWISTRRLHKSGGGKASVWPLISNLGGTVVFELDDPATTKYGLTLLGIMLSTEGNRLEQVLVHYLAFARQIALDEPERTHILSGEVSNALRLSIDQLSELGELLLLSPFSAGGSYSREEWNIGLPRNIEDIPEDLTEHVSSTAVEGFDPAAPVSYRERIAYESARRLAGGTPRVGIAAAHEPSGSEGGAFEESPLGAHLALRHENPQAFDTSLETYSTEEVLGEGGSGRVFLVRDTKGSRFAVKSLCPELVSTDRVRRFRNELSFSQRNTHQNILSIVDHGFIPLGDLKVPFYVMPVYPTTLRKEIALGLPPEAAFELFLRILDGLEVAHKRGIWHRDLKPENVLLDPAAGRLVVADFGIAHFAEEELFTAVRTQRSERLANFMYAAPEQRTRGQEVDARADIYALGLMLNEIFTGRAPLGTGFRTVSEAAPAFGFLDPVVDRMIRQSPGQRHPSLSEVRTEITDTIKARVLPTAQVRAHNHSTSGETPPAMYRAEVDTAGRLDNHSVDTVMCISAGLSFSLLMPAQEKAATLASIAQARPSWGHTRQRVLLHSALLYLLLRDHVAKLDVAVIDPEYKGYEPEIKGYLLRSLRADGLPVRRDQILFQRIDRGSPARRMAARVYRRESPPDLLIGAKAVAEILCKEKIGAPGFTDGRGS